MVRKGSSNYPVFPNMTSVLNYGNFIKVIDGLTELDFENKKDKDYIMSNFNGIMRQLGNTLEYEGIISGDSEIVGNLARFRFFN
jgi:hypothetical protein